MGAIWEPVTAPVPMLSRLFALTRGGQQDPQTSRQANARLQDQIPSAFSCTEVQGITFQGQQTKHILSVNFCFLLASRITKIKTPLWCEKKKKKTPFGAKKKKKKKKKKK